MKGHHTPDVEMFVDASAFGWGCITFTNDGVKTFGAPWSEYDRMIHNVHSSVCAEPLALRKATVASGVCSKHKHVRAFVDHQPLVFAFGAADARGARARSYNDCIRDIRQLCAAHHTVFSVAFVPGELNRTADKISRQWQFCS